jgi:tetratricopeptide (TPR) repeat protein
MSTNNLSEINYNKGIQYYEKGQYDLAIACFRKAIANNNTTPQFYYNLGLAYVKKGEPDLAISNFKEALALSPDDPDISLNLGITYSLRGDFAKAINSYKKALAHSPNDPDIYDNLGIATFSIKNYFDAIMYFQKSLELNPKNASVAYNLAYAYYVNKQYDMARDGFIYSISLNDEDDEAYFNLGNIYLAQNEKTLAIESFQRTLSLNPEHAGAKNALNKLNKVEDKPKLPEDKPKSSSEKQNIKEKTPVKEKPIPKSREIYIKYIKNGQYNLAIDTLKKAIIENPREPENHFVLGTVYIEKKDYYQAIDSLRETLSLDPDHQEAQDTLFDVIKILNTYKDETKDYFQLAIIYIQKQNYIDALNALGKVLELKPEDAKSKKLFAKIMTLIDETSTNFNSKFIDQKIVQQIVQIKKQLQENPKNHELYYKLGIIYGQLKKYDVALDSFKKAIKLKPDYKDAQKSLFDLMKLINA